MTNRKIHVAGYRSMVWGAFLRRLGAPGRGGGAVADHPHPCRDEPYRSSGDERFQGTWKPEVLPWQWKVQRDPCQLGWVLQFTAREMRAEMMAEYLKTAWRHALLKAHGTEMPVSVEG